MPIPTPYYHPLFILLSLTTLLVVGGCAEEEPEPEFYLSLTIEGSPNGHTGMYLAGSGERWRAGEFAYVDSLTEIREAENDPQGSRSGYSRQSICANLPHSSTGLDGNQALNVRVREWLAYTNVDAGEPYHGTAQYSEADGEFVFSADDGATNATYAKIWIDRRSGDGVLMGRLSISARSGAPAGWVRLEGHFRLPVISSEYVSVYPPAPCLRGQGDD